MTPSTKQQASGRAAGPGRLIGVGIVVVAAGVLALVGVVVSGSNSTGSVSVRSAAGGSTGSGAKANAPVSASGAGVKANGSAGHLATGSGGTSSTSIIGATGALEAYLQGLSRLNVEDVAASSNGGPFAVAGILLDAAAINSERGATTTASLGPSSFAPVSAGSTNATLIFQGSVTLTTNISGPKGNGTFTDTISGPVTVTIDSGIWRVTNFTYDNLPVQVWSESESQTVNGLNVSLGYVVSYGNATAALVTLRQGSGNANVQLRAVTLRAGGAAENGVGDFTGPPTPTGVLRFARIASAPTSLTLLFTSSTGQTDYFDFTLS